jgi:SNF2 family DNA or RNA helicase
VRLKERSSHFAFTHDALILDEAHYVRSASAQRTQLLLGREGLAVKMPIVLPASGTPMWKHPGNLWTVLAMLFPHVVRAAGFTKYDEWMEHFAERTFDFYTKREVVYPRVKHADELRAILQQVMLRREWEDVGMDVPEIIWSQLPVDAARVRIDAATAKAVRQALEGDTTAGDDLALATFRRQVGEAKAPAIAQLLADELDGGEHSLVVFAHHHSVLAILQEHLQRFTLVRVDGSTTPKQRDAAVDAFQSGRARVYLGQTAANREAITLSRADRAVIVEPDWTANTNVQAGQRVVAPGKRARIDLVSLAGTLDDAVVNRHLAEVRIAQEVISNGSRSLRAGSLVR